jgi:hypothetical protein
VNSKQSGGKKLARVTSGRCYDNNFLRFLTIFVEKNGFFLKNKCCDQIFAYFSFVLSKKTNNFLANFFRKYFKNKKIGPRWGEFSPIVQLFTYFGQFQKTTEADHIFMLLFPQYKICIDLVKTWIGPHFGRLFSQTHLVALIRWSARFGFRTHGSRVLLNAVVDYEF